MVGGRRTGAVKPVVLIGAVLVLAIVLVVYLMIPQDERLIRKHLSTLAETLDKEEGESPLIAAVTAKSIAGYFTQDASIHVGSPVGTLQGHQAIVASAARARPALAGASFGFKDVNVTLNSDSSAEVFATVEVKAKHRSGETDYQVRELRLLFSKVDGDWLISQVETVATLE